MTVNEAAVVTAVYSLVVTVGMHRDLHLWRDVPRFLAFFTAAAPGPGPEHVCA